MDCNMVPTLRGILRSLRFLMNFICIGILYYNYKAVKFDSDSKLLPGVARHEDLHSYNTRHSNDLLLILLLSLVK